MNKILRVKELIEILKDYDENLPCVITHDGKGHQYPVTEEWLHELEYAYFPSGDQVFEEGQQFLQIGST